MVRRLPFTIWDPTLEALSCEFVFSLRGGTLQRVCFLLHVRPDRLEEYKARHREVWPDMIRALRESGWSNYSLFLRPDGLPGGISGNFRFRPGAGGGKWRLSSCLTMAIPGLMKRCLPSKRFSTWIPKWSVREYSLSRQGRPLTATMLKMCRGRATIKAVPVAVSPRNRHA